LLKTRPDCAILDLNLPDGDGATVLAAIRDSGLATRVVVATGTGDHDHFERVRRLGPERLLRKPVFLDELLEAFGVKR
jgi:CheY-like chemotaxis protein